MNQKASAEMTREPLRRRYSDKFDREMNLPRGKTCADCIHCRKCCAIFGHIPQDEVCDWHPSRFHERKFGIAAVHP